MKEKTQKTHTKHHKPMNAQQMKKVAGGATSGEATHGLVGKKPQDAKKIIR